MATTMKQGIITLLPKPDEDHLQLDNWRPITLLNVNYKILSLLFARCLRKDLSEIMNQTETGFMNNSLISCNIKFILDFIYYSEFDDSGALILFLDFCKAFHSVEHQFLFQSLQTFGFGERFVSFVKMLYKDTSSLVMLFPNTTTTKKKNQFVGRNT